MAMGLAAEGWRIVVRGRCQQLGLFRLGLLSPAMAGVNTEMNFAGESNGAERKPEPELAPPGARWAPPEARYRTQGSRYAVSGERTFFPAADPGDRFVPEIAHWNGERPCGPGPTQFCHCAHP